MRDLSKVITEMLEVIPATEVGLRLSLQAIQTSARYAAPEIQVNWWHQMVNLLNDTNPTGKDWELALADIVSGKTSKVEDVEVESSPLTGSKEKKMTSGYDNAFPLDIGEGAPAEGLNKREYFAAQAMQLFNIDRNDLLKIVNGEKPAHSIVANFCVDLADALIEALNKNRE